ncbi:class D sortase [Clostridium perfringens]|uniref:Class D sortase n=1 Tax=Clostridium perfringens TaxID=1502 RepID=A0A133MN96_CLOPF|nr:class D sortase [Clostridium perfringens]EGT3599451.1 class D sortase [Clostridium perfringens]EGT5617901.1 class D sortase [Clostridium perfringens]KXA05512.1 sortase family protein [Clostridium perfringens]MBS5920016.1 class D sortase [Clostridium perfringens]MCH1963942.1 class D sortase [Clostridium perfringens]
MWGKIRNVLGILLIVAGVSLIGVTIWMKYDTYRQQQAVLDSFRNLQFDVPEGENKDRETLEEDTKENSDEKNKADKGEVEKDKKPEKAQLEEGKGIAILNIPKINLEIGIIEGVRYEDIKYVVGHFPGSPMPGEKGNFSIAGHRISYFGQAFKDIDKLEKGDKVKVTYNGKEYTYEVTDMYEVTPDETEALNPTKDATITIVTCTTDAKNRVIVKGKLVE